MAYQYVREPLLAEEADRLCHVCDEPLEKLIIWVLLDTGLRVSELCGLSKVNIQWQQKSLRITGKGGIYGKKSKKRVVPMSKRVQTLLEHWFALHEKIPVGIRQTQKIVKRLANKAQISKEVTPHVLRHTFATLALQKGISLAAVQKILGHDRLTTTTIYLNFTDIHVVDEFIAKCAKDTVYPVIKEEITNKELAECFLPTEDEILFCKNETRSNLNFLFMLIILKSFQRYGYTVLLSELKNKIIEFISENVDVRVTKDEINIYDLSRIRRRHSSVIKKFLKIKSFTEDGENFVSEIAYNLSKSRENTADIINGTIDALIREHYELPAFSTLFRLCKHQKVMVYKEIFEQIFSSLDDLDKIKIKELFTYSKENTRSEWDKIKFEIPNAKQKNIKKLGELVKILSVWNKLICKLDDIPLNKLNQFVAEANALDLYEILETEEKKRCTLVLSLIKMKKSNAIDNLVKIFQKEMAKIRIMAEKKLKKYIEQHQDKTDKIITSFSKANDIFSNEKIAESDKFSPIKNILSKDIDLVAYAKTHAEFGGKKPIRFMAQYFSNKKHIFFQILELLKINSTSQDNSMVNAIEFMMKNRYSRGKWIFTRNLKKENDSYLQSTKWIRNRWWYLVTGIRKRNFFPEEVKKEQFEVCVCEHISFELKSGDLFVEDSVEYSDWRKELLSWERSQSTLASFGQMVGIPVEKSEFIHHVKEILIKKAQEAEDKYDPINNFSIENGKPILRRTPGKWKNKKNHEENDIVQEHLGEDIPLLQVLFDTDHWLDWTKVFTPHSGHQSKLKDEVHHIVAMVFSYGTGLGPREGSHLIQGFTDRQLSRTNKKMVTAEKIDKAIGIIGNSYMKLQLPLLWGDGTRFSVDGTLVNLSQNDPFAQRHIRYGQWGAIAYYHVADNYIAIFSKFIPCGVHEAVHILDPLINKLVEVKGNIIHGDTHAQSSAVYGLAFLLGIKLMPRIKNWKDIKLYKPSPEFVYKNIEDLFTNDLAECELIERYLHEMIQIAQSIMSGKITPSAILRRLGTYSRKNKVFQAFSALGKIIRTSYLLEYLTDLELRQVVHGSTVKSEQFNGFTQWIYFAKDYIASVVHDEQVKIIKYNHLIAVILSFWNAWQMTEKISKLRSGGYVFAENELERMSPYRRKHINRFGKISIDFLNPDPVDYELRVKPDFSMAL